MIAPKKEGDIAALCTQMLAGLSAHAADFPSVTEPMRESLEAQLAAYAQNRAEQAEAKGQLRLKTFSKYQSLSELAAVMRNCLKHAEADCSSLPEKLSQIGWGPRATPVPAPVPQPPQLLSIAAQGQTDIWLKWDLPAAKCSINNWIVERGESIGGPWILVGSTVNKEIHLSAQPRGVEMAYRVKAVNNSGQSEASNIVTAVL